MKKIGNRIKKQISRKEMFMEDLRLLQKNISGSSVYKSYVKAYKRTPKYGKLEYENYR